MFVIYLKNHTVGFDVQFDVDVNTHKEPNEMTIQLKINDQNVDISKIAQWNKIEYIQGLFEHGLITIYEALMLMDILPSTIENPWRLQA